MEPKIRTLCTEPIRCFSVRRNYFFIAHRMKLTESLPPCFEEVTVCLYVLDGCGKAVVNGLEIDLQPGCECLFNTYHVFEVIPDDDAPLDLVLFAVDNAMMNYLIFNTRTPKESNDVFYTCPVVLLDDGQQREYEDLLARFGEEDQRKDGFAIQIKAGLFGQLSQIRHEAQQKSRSSFTPPLGWNILLFLTKFNSQNLTATDVARNFGLSVAAMNRELRRITTYNFNQLLSRARINTVCSLLPLEGLSLRFLGNYIGFSSENSFYRAFRTWKGMNPQEYRDTVLRQVWGYSSKGIQDIPWSILNYICENYSAPISIRTAAENLYVSESSINQILLDCAGVTFQEQLIQHWLHYAEALLLTTSMPICDVAAESGFGSMNTFCRLFKEKHGLTAGGYRKARGGEDDGQ